MIPCLPVKIKEVFQNGTHNSKNREIHRTDGYGRSGEAGYQMGLRDMLALCDVADRDTSLAVCEAFLFGKAKGYRAAKAR